MRKFLPLVLLLASCSWPFGPGPAPIDKLDAKIVALTECEPAGWPRGSECLPGELLDPDDPLNVDSIPTDRPWVAVGTIHWARDYIWLLEWADCRVMGDCASSQLYSPLHLSEAILVYQGLWVNVPDKYWLILKVTLDNKVVADTLEFVITQQIDTLTAVRSLVRQ